MSEPRQPHEEDNPGEDALPAGADAALVARLRALEADNQRLRERYEAVAKGKSVVLIDGARNTRHTLVGVEHNAGDSAILQARRGCPGHGRGRAEPARGDGLPGRMDHPHGAAALSAPVARALVEALRAYRDPRGRGRCDNCGGGRLDDNFLCGDCGRPSGLFGQLISELAARHTEQGALPAAPVAGGRHARDDGR